MGEGGLRGEARGGVRGGRVGASGRQRHWLTGWGEGEAGGEG
jgi:hypothetical protein